MSLFSFQILFFNRSHSNCLIINSFLLAYVAMAITDICKHYHYIFIGVLNYLRPFFFNFYITYCIRSISTFLHFPTTRILNKF